MGRVTIDLWVPITATTANSDGVHAHARLEFMHYGVLGEAPAPSANLVDSASERPPSTVDEEASPYTISLWRFWAERVIQ